MRQVLRPLAEKRGLDNWEDIVNFTKDACFPSRFPFGKFKRRLFQEAREGAKLRLWLEMKIFEHPSIPGGFDSPPLAAIEKE